MITARQIPGSEPAPKSVQSKMDTLVITPEVVAQWEKPPFQRELRKTDKFFDVVAAIKATETVPGVLTLGKVTGDPTTYLADGQHRSAAFLESGLTEAVADVRICQFDDLQEMAREFRILNGKIAVMKTDDILRAMEAGGNTNLSKLRRECPFVGYNNVKHVQAKTTGVAKTVLSVATAVRLWAGSDSEAPFAAQTEASVNAMTPQTTSELIGFLATAYEAWGGDKSNLGLYSSLTLAILMWMYRRIVLAPAAPHRTGGAMSLHLDRQSWVRCLMELAADKGYADWIGGRILRDRDRSPAYNRIRSAFARRLAAMGVKSPRFPSADWMRL